MKKKFILFILIITSSLIIAQVNPKKCLTTKLVNQEILNNPEYAKELERVMSNNTDFLSSNISERNTLNIPVVIHIIHKDIYTNIGDGNNLSNAQIEDALRILNEDYSKTNPEFPNPPRSTFVNYAGNPDMKFCLATTDPNGNTTTGITRTPTSKTSFDSDSESNDMKKSISGGIDAWDPTKYLNIWICNLFTSGLGEVLGYAYLPGLSGNQIWKDGLVVDYQYFGTVVGASSNSDGRTGTHEIGHYLGLSHTFCEDGSCCDNDDSFWAGNINDTPACYDQNNGGPYYGPVNNNTNNNTCNDLQYNNSFNTNIRDMDENYMAYSRDTWMFSIDQVNQMNSILSNFRSDLKNTTISMNCTGTIGVTANWDCMPSGVCIDFGVGYGVYASLDDCKSASTCITSSENLNSKISIYPNPVKDKIIIDGEYLIANILDMYGKIVLTSKTSNLINTSSLKNGVYFIRIKTNNGILNEKIIIQ